MDYQVVIYISGAILLGIGGLVSWYVRYSIRKAKENWEKVFNELALIKETYSGQKKDIGFLYGTQKEHSQRIEKHGNKLMNIESRLTRTETIIGQK